MSSAYEITAKDLDRLFPKAEDDGSNYFGCPTPNFVVDKEGNLLGTANNLLEAEQVADKFDGYETIEVRQLFPDFLVRILVENDDLPTIQNLIGDAQRIAIGKVGETHSLLTFMLDDEPEWLENLEDELDSPCLYEVHEIECDEFCLFNTDEYEATESEGLLFEIMDVFPNCDETEWWANPYSYEQVYEKVCEAGFLSEE